MRSMKDAMAPKTVAATTRAEASGQGRRAVNIPLHGQIVDGLGPGVSPQSEHHQRRFRRQTILQAVS